jgi:DNA-binding beta-propeller fold protein YncE
MPTLVTNKIVIPRTMPMQSISFRLFVVQFIVVGFLLLTLISSISGCSAFASTYSSTDELPTLQAILPFTNREYPKYVSVIPDTYTYVVDELGPIIVLNGIEVVTVIPIPPEDKNNVGYFDRMAIHPQTKLGYLPNANTDNVYVIQGTEMITTLQKVGDAPLSIGINPNTNLAYIGYASDEAGAITEGNRIAVIAGTNVVTLVNTGIAPNVIASDPNNSKVYIGQSLIKEAPYSYEKQSLLTILDSTTIVTQTRLNYDQDMPGFSGSDINNIAIDRNSGEIYMIEGLGRIIYWHNGETKRIRAGSMGYTGLHDIAIDPNRGLAYVSSWGDPQSHVVVLKAGEIVTALPVGTDPRAVVYDETHDYVYVANNEAHSLSIIRNTEVITTMNAYGSPWDIAVDEERGYIYLANPDSHNITIFGFESEISKRSFWDFLPFIGR